MRQQYFGIWSLMMTAEIESFHFASTRDCYVRTRGTRQPHGGTEYIV